MRVHTSANLRVMGRPLTAESHIVLDGRAIATKTTAFARLRIWIIALALAGLATAGAIFTADRMEAEALKIEAELESRAW